MADYNSDRTGSNIDAVLDKADNLTQAAVGVGGNVGIGTASPSAPLSLNRTVSDGTILDLRKDGSTVGSIGSYAGSYLTIGTGDSGLLFQDDANEIIPRNSGGAVSDANLNLGAVTSRFKDLYLSGGVYLGGTGAANKLDDYETGNWSPVLKSSGNAIMTLSAANGYYTKVGNKVTGWFECEASVDLTDLNYYTIEGIPFSISTNHANSKHIGSANSAQTTTSRGLMHSLQYINSASLRVFVHSDGTTNKNFDYSDAIYGTFTYFVA